MSDSIKMATIPELTGSAEITKFRKKATDTHKKVYKEEATRDNLEAYQKARTELINRLQGNVEYWRDHNLQMTAEEGPEEVEKAKGALRDALLNVNIALENFQDPAKLLQGMDEVPAQAAPAAAASGSVTVAQPPVPRVLGIESIRKFSATEDDYNAAQFVRAFDECAKLSRWSDYETVAYFKNRLTGNPLGWLALRQDEQPPNTWIKSWALVKTKFLERWQKQLTAGEQAVIMKTAFKYDAKKYVDFRAYLDECLRVVYMLESDDPATGEEKIWYSAHRKKFALRMCLMNLPDVAIEYITEKKASSWDEVRAALETVQAKLDNLKKPVTDQRGHMKGIEVAAVEEAIDEGGTDNMEACALQKKPFKKKPWTGSPGTKSAQRRKDEAENRCYKCHEVGHRINKCPQWGNKPNTQRQGAGPGPSAPPHQPSSHWYRPQPQAHAVAAYPSPPASGCAGCMGVIGGCCG